MAFWQHWPEVQHPPATVVMLVAPIRKRSRAHLWRARALLMSCVTVTQES